MLADDRFPGRPSSAIGRRSFLGAALACAAGTRAAWADEKLAGIACRSVHLAYPAPLASAYLNEVSVETSAPGTYFCVCGFNQGYFGIQELGNGKKVAIFSVWDPGKQDDPNSVDPAQRVKLVEHDPEVRVKRFGGEGTGGQSFLDLDWTIGKTYRCLVTAQRDPDDRARMRYTGYLATPDAPAWRRLVTFSTLTPRSGLSGLYAFIEDFRRNRVSATQARSAHLRSGWVRLEEGAAWRPLAKARFTADSNPSLAIDAEPRGSRFRLATGGKTENVHAKLRSEMTLQEPPRGIDQRATLRPSLDASQTMATAKTNAARLLETLGIAHEIRAYEVDPNDLSAESVAAKVGLPPEQVFKTLVARGDRHGVCLAVVPGDAMLDLKALARVTGDRKVDTARLEEVQPLTGYIRGGVTALACKKDYPTYVDETVHLFDVICVSAGQRGLQIVLNPDDYLRACRGKLAAIAKPKDPS